MRKLLSILTLLPIISFASSLDMSKLECKGMKLNAATTLTKVQDTCLLKSQEMDSNGLFRVKFINDATGDTVSCYFATRRPTALLNSCK